MTLHQHNGYHNPGRKTARYIVALVTR